MNELEGGVHTNKLTNFEWDTQRDIHTYKIALMYSALLPILAIIIVLFCLFLAFKFKIRAYTP